MRPSTGVISSHTLEPIGTPALVVEFSTAIIFGVGQFMLAYQPEAGEAFRSRLFPVSISPQQIVFDHVPSPSWLPGEKIDMLGPIGNTFSPPATARNWHLISLGQHPERLLPLLKLASAQSASVAFWSATTLAGLPANVERPVAAEDVINWADFIAIELAGSEWPDGHRVLREELMHKSNASIQVLVDVPTPCGFGACQTCAMPQRGGWILTCQMGLVRQFEEFRD